MSREREREGPDRQAQIFFRDVSQWTGLVVPLSDRFIDGVKTLYHKGWKASDTLSTSLKMLQAIDTYMQYVYTSVDKTRGLLDEPAILRAALFSWAFLKHIPEKDGFRKAFVHVVFCDTLLAFQKKSHIHSERS